MKILLINPPVYTPTTYSYALAMMKGELQAALEEDIQAFDANANFHCNEFQEYYERLHSDKEEYFKLLEEFSEFAKRVYSQISKDAIQGKTPKGTNETVNKIIDMNPNIVAISVSYNSQIFMTEKIVEELQKKGIKVIIGGPADYSKIISKNKEILSLGSAKELIKYLVSIGAKEKELQKTAIPDFSNFKKEEYFTKDIVYPLRTSNSCPYKRCTFCTHHGNKKYVEFDISSLKETIQRNNIKKICFVDDDLTAKRIKEISLILKDLDVTWWCQLRPIKLIKLVLNEAYESGLRSVAWGLESGNKRILDFIQKGTNTKDIAEILKEAKELGITNMAYVLFGFPTETLEEFEDTINFLKINKDHIDLISPSIFGLQYGSKVFENPELFDVKDIHFDKRTLLSDKISYKTASGLTQNEVKKLKKEHNNTLQRINKLPRIISVFKEQVLNVDLEK